MVNKALLMLNLTGDKTNTEEGTKILKIVIGLLPVRKLCILELEDNLAHLFSEKWYRFFSLVKKYMVALLCYKIICNTAEIIDFFFKCTTVRDR